MSITVAHDLRCRCGETLHVQLVESLNAGRHPALRQQVLDRNLHLFECHYCSVRTLIERPFVYFDFERCQLIGVYPLHDLERAQTCAEQVMEIYRQRLLYDAPDMVRARAGDFLVRVCFGYEELREKLVADDAGLSDLVLEALKCELIAGDARLRAAALVTLRLDAITAEGDLAFLGDWMVPPPVVLRILITRDDYDAVAARRATLLDELPGLASGPHVSLLRLAGLLR